LKCEGYSKDTKLIWFKEYSLPELEFFTKQTGLVKLLGITISAIGADYLCASMEVTADLLQIHGIMHGGATCVLVETVGSFASRMCLDPEQQYSVGSFIHVNHLRPIENGIVIATCKPVHLGRQKHVWDIDVNAAGNDKLIAKGELTCAVLNR